MADITDDFDDGGGDDDADFDYTVLHQPCKLIIRTTSLSNVCHGNGQNFKKNFKGKLWNTFCKEHFPSFNLQKVALISNCKGKIPNRCS